VTNFTYHPCDDRVLASCGIEVTDEVRRLVAEIGLGKVLQERHEEDEKMRKGQE